MKNSQLRYSIFSLVIAVLCAPAAGKADTITVKKVKGNQAIVESATPLEEGQTYELATEEVAQDVDYKAGMSRSRNNSLSFGTKFGYLKSDTTESTAFDLQIRYGWNFSNLEVGIVADVDSLDQGGGATTTLKGGGYFDYNIIQNRDPKKWIWGPFALVEAGSKQIGGSTGGSTSLLDVNAGAFLTYFFTGSTTALRGEGFFNMEQVNTSATQTSLQGFGLRGLLVFYF